MGIEHHENGVNNIRAIASIGAICGCIDKPGGEIIVDGLSLPSLTLYDELPLKEIQPIGKREFPIICKYRQECNTMIGMEANSKGIHILLRE